MLAMKKEGKHSWKKCKCEAGTQNEKKISADIASNLEMLAICPKLKFVKKNAAAARRPARKSKTNVSKV